MIVRIHPDNPDERNINKVVECLKKGGIVVYPTDTVYGIGCDITNQQAVEKILRFKDINIKKTNLSFICHDMSHISDYVKPLDNSIFKLMKKNLPGPFTFILEANNNVPKLFKANKKTVGIRIPDNKIIREIVKVLENPVLSTSVKQSDDEENEYITDPELIEEKLGGFADIIIDGGEGGYEGSTVIDFTQGGYEIVRQGKGMLIE